METTVFVRRDGETFRKTFSEEAEGFVVVLYIAGPVPHKFIELQEMIRYPFIGSDNKYQSMTKVYSFSLGSSQDLLFSKKSGKNTEMDM